MRRRGTKKKGPTEEVGEKAAPVLPSRDYLQPVQKLFKEKKIDLDPRIKYQDGKNVFDGSIESHDLLYQILHIYHQGNADQIEEMKQHLAQKWLSFDQLYWSLPIFETSRVDLIEEENSYFNQVSIEKGSIKCKNSNCESFRVVSHMLGTKAGDEAHRARYTCTRCGVQWTE